MRDPGERLADEVDHGLSRPAFIGDLISFAYRSRLGFGDRALVRPRQRRYLPLSEALLASIRGAGFFRTSFRMVPSLTPSTFAACRLLSPLGDLLMLDAG